MAVLVVVFFFGRVGGGLGLALAPVRLFLFTARLCDL